MSIALPPFLAPSLESRPAAAPVLPPHEGYTLTLPLRAAPGMKMSGRIVVRAAPAAAPDTRRLRVGLPPQEPLTFTPE